MSTPIYEIQKDHVYRSVNGYPMIVDGFSKHAMDCSIRMVNYTNLEPTFDSPPGESWTLEESIFLKRFTEDEKLSKLGPRNRVSLEKTLAGLGPSPEMRLNFRIKRSNLIIFKDLPLRETANALYYDSTNGGHRLTNYRTCDVNKDGRRPPPLVGTIKELVFNNNYPPLDTWVVLKERYGVYTLGIRLEKYAVKNDKPSYYTLDGFVKDNLPWAFI